MPGPAALIDSEPPDKGGKRINVHEENIIHVSDDEGMCDNTNVSDGNDNTEINKNQEKMITDNAQKNSEILGQPKFKYIDTDNRYANNSPGPFVVYVEHSNLNIGRLHPMRLGEKLMRIEDSEECIKEINVIGKNRVKIEVTSAGAANRLVNNSIFSENELIAYIPLHLTEKRGILRGVDTSYSETELVDNIKSNIPIKSVRRLYRFITKEGQNVKVPRQMIVVTFKKVELPQYVFINKVRFEVNCYYSPVVLCYNCLRYGHTSKQCKGVRRCRTCGSSNDKCFDSEANSPGCTKFCVNCKSDSHNTTDKSCPMFLNQKRIKECMAHLNISFNEAQKTVDNPTYASLVNKNRFFPLISNVNFPELHPKGTEYAASSSKSQITRSNGSSQTSYSGNVSKKRKVRDISPHLPQIQREIPWSFGGKPIIDMNAPPQFNFEALKHKIVIELGGLINDFCKNFAAPIQQGEVINIIGSSINQLINNLFEDFQIQSQN